MIPIELVQAVAEDLTARAAIDIPEDYLTGLRGMAETETGDLSSFVLKAMVDNYDAAKEDRRAMCADTGVPRWYVKYGNEARMEGGPVAVEAALRRAVAKATAEIPLRPNRVHPLWRTDHNNNVGINAPEIEYSFEPDAALGRADHGAQGRPVRHRLPDAVSRRRPRPASSASTSMRWWHSASGGSPASPPSSASASAAPRTSR